MSEHKSTGRGFNGKGYYIALILCAAAIGISGYLYYQNNTQQPQTQLEQPGGDLSDSGKDVPVIATRPGSDLEPSTQPTETTPMKAPLKTGLPVNGSTLSAYAMECLTYNETTRDWRVHNGMDIGAEEGTPVCAAADGTVYTVYDDDTMGKTVVIRHDGGYTTKYSSLAEEVPVRPGDSVTLGQPIGCVGETAIMECAIGCHVHFTVLCNDVVVDPAGFLNLS